MTNSHQQSIGDAGSKNHPPMLEKGSYVPLASHFMRYIDREKAFGKMLKDSITNDPYKMKKMNDPWNLASDAIVEYDLLYDFLKQNEVNVNASKAKRAAKAHDPLALVANTYASPSHSRSSPAYYVTHPPSKGHYARACSKPRLQDSNYFRQQMILAKQDKAGITLDEEHNNFLLADILEDEEMEELNASCIMMARIQTDANESDVEPSYDLDFMDEVQDCSSSFLEGLFSKDNHEQSHHEQHNTIKPTYDDDQIDSNIKFDNPNKGINSDNVEQDNNAHDQQRAELESLLRNVQTECANT
ncbi:hypothetical protein Tco_0060021 [Tanacetum coccineum]